MKVPARHTQSALALALVGATSLHCTSAHDAPGPPDEAALVPEAAAMMRAAGPLPSGTPGHPAGDRLETAGGAATSWSGARLALSLPSSARDPMLLEVPGEKSPVVIHRLDPGEGTRQIDGNLVRYRGAARGTDAVLFARGAELEELLVVHQPVVTGYRLTLPDHWQARHGAGASTIEIADAAGRSRVVMRAARAWDATGAALAVDVALDHDVVTLQARGARAYPVVIDPSWSSALAPIRIRSESTATLLGTGEILVAGGGSTPRSTELIDPYRSTIVLGPDMTEARQSHTATMLQSGKVLLAGGGKATAELFDPITRTVAPTGPMSRPRTSHAAVRLRNGKVLVVGSLGGDATAELYDPGAGSFTLTSARRTTGHGAMVLLSSGQALFSNGADSEVFDPAAAGGAGAWGAPPTSLPQSQVETPSLTLLRNGRLMMATGDACGSLGIESCQGSVFNLDLGGGFGSSNTFVTGRAQPTAALLPSGNVVYAGGRPGDSIETAELATGSGPVNVSSDGTTSAGHGIDSTSVVLPGGDVLVIGGTQATIDRRTHLGALHDSAGPMVAPRVDHSAVRLHDGRVLVTGGTRGSAPLPAGIERELSATELFDPSTDLFATGGSMTVARYGHTSTTLRSGKVLITGGAHGTPVTIHASAELYDPAAPLATRTRAVGSMGTARTGHLATLLPSGHVLITGGRTAGAAGAVSSAELYDPATEAFAALPPMTAARASHGAVVLPTGKVLLVGGAGASAELFDPLTRTFKETLPTGSAREGSTAHLLPDGRVFVAGGATLAPDIFDPKTETWSFAGPQPATFPRMLWSMRPDGRLVSAGGRFPLNGLNNQQFMFDPLATPVGSFQQVAQDGRVARDLATMTLAGSGEVALIGGTLCYGACSNPPETLALLHDDGAPASARPVLGALPATVTAGTKVPITGTGFASGPEGSGGAHNSSATNHPLALWVSDAGDAIVPGTILEFTDTTATWLVPATALHGHGLLFVSSGGVLSAGASVTIEPAAKAVSCTFDAECATGFCTDGVCCDRRCDANCEGCSARRKTSGEDGVCGPVPPGRDIAGRCFSLPGQSCTEAIACATGFCAQGVCCDSSCTGECQSCNQENSAGICSSINEGACGAACDGDHTLKQVGAPDVDCAPFNCEGPRCKTSCASVNDCAAPFVCDLDGQCTAPTEPVPGTGGVCGCKVVGGARGPGGGLGGAAVAFAVALLAWSRARVRGRP